MANRELDAAISKIVNGFMDLKDVLKQISANTENNTNVQSQSVPELQINENDFETLKAALESDRWPEAVNKSLICDPESETDKVERGKGIIELMIDENLDEGGLKILDFGCGEGHCAQVAGDYNVAKSVGYDIKKYDSWDRFERKENVLITNNYDEVLEHAPYDVIVLFDVIDHVEKESPVDMLKRVNDLLKSGGKIYMRCHPYVSRHATHLYHDLNKAYIHLVFNPDEIRRIIPESKYEESNIGVTYPIRTYNDYVSQAGLKVVTRREIKDNVEPFFKIPKIAERIIANTKMEQFPDFQLSLQFLDYVLTK